MHVEYNYVINNIQIDIIFNSLKWDVSNLETEILP